jgi:hypothetical protein
MKAAVQRSNTSASSSLLLLLLLTFYCNTICFIDAAAAAGTCSLLLDKCTSTLDLTCDANGITCPTGTDCFDCDPCMGFAAQGCSACTSAGCYWCSFPGINGEVGICSSPSVFAEVPHICLNANGTAYTASCAAAAATSPTAPTSYTCDAAEYATDPCPFQLNGKCDANGITCPLGTDCFDCDPCRLHRFQGCETCTAAGCQWCGLDVACFSPTSFSATTPVLHPQLLCGASDFVNTCSASSSSSSTGNVFTDPFYDANSWIYDLINIKEVWKSGISKWLMLYVGFNLFALRTITSFQSSRRILL